MAKIMPTEDVFAISHREAAMFSLPESQRGRAKNGQANRQIFLAL